MAQIIKQNLKNNPTKLSIIIVRIFIGCMWLSEGLIKVIDRNSNPLTDYHSFLSQIKLMADTNPLSFIRSFVNDWFVPNYVFLAWIVIVLEIFLGLSAIFGLFSRIGSIMGTIYGGILYLSTLGWGDWPWSYFLIIMAMLVILISGFEMRVGLDSYLFEKYKNRKFVSWLL